MEHIRAVGSFTLGSADPSLFAFTRTGFATAWSRQLPACRPDNVRLPSGEIFLRERKHNWAVVNTRPGFKTYLLGKKTKTHSSVESKGSQWRGKHVEVKVPAVRWNQWQCSYNSSPPLKLWSVSLCGTSHLQRFLPPQNVDRF